MPKLTNKGLARKALKTIEPKTVEPIEKPNQLKSDSAEEQQNGAKLSNIEQEIVKAEKLLSLSNRAEEVIAETSTKADRFGVITGQRREVDISEVHKTSIDKHVESMRFKIVWVANKLADELIHETSKKTKKDKEYIKGLVWSFGTMYDKLAGISTDTVQVHIPTKLLEGVKSAISIQIARVQQIDQSLEPLRSIPNQHSDAPEAATTIDITPKAGTLSSSPEVILRNTNSDSPPTQDTTT